MLDIEDALSELIDDRDFEDLNRRFGRLNLFEALGAPRRELEHSNFLAFLLSPNRPHGLGSEPLRRMLRMFIEVLPRDKRPVRLLDVMVADLDDTIVYRERDNIDLLLEIPELNLIVIIENKVGAKAGDGQLERYVLRTRTVYPQHRHLFVFLTPESTDPENESYVAISYLQIAATIESLVSDTAEAHGGEVRLILQHYLEMLRRHVVPDEHLKELALRIYERHREAFEFVFQCRPEAASMLGFVQGLISKQPALVLDRQAPSIARFVPQAWMNIPALNACPPDQWTKTRRNVLFEIKTFKTETYEYSDRILLALILGPSKPDIREHFFALAHAHRETFVGAGGSIGKSWATIFSKELLSKAAGANMDDEQRELAVSVAWNTFIEHDLPKLTAKIIDLAASAPVQ